MSDAAKISIEEPAVSEPITDYLVPSVLPQNLESPIAEADVQTRTIVTDFAELDDGTLIDLIEGFDHLHNTMF